MADNNPERRVRPKINWILTSLGAVGAILLAGILSIFFVLSFGRVAGEEFSPDSLRSRSFVYYQIPFIQRQVFPIDRVDQTGSFQKKLRVHGYANNSAEPRWDLVADNRTDERSPACDASILVSYLRMRDRSGDLKWEAWTIENPEMAKSLWPNVFALARLREYLLLPDLFRLAEKARTKQELEIDTRLFLRPYFAQLITDMKQDDADPERIESYVAELRRLDPTHPLVN